ncbi:hypothetical protein pb186bvf_004407 [Paramecium bursaria]
MGITKSRAILLTTYELQDFADTANLQLSDVQYLYKIFLNLSSLHKDDGVIDMQEFHNGMQYKSEEASQLFFKRIDINGDNVINFREFILGLSVFLNQNRTGQIKYLFKLLDKQNQNLITKQSMIELLQCLLSNYPEIKLNQNEIEKMVNEELRQILNNRERMMSSFSEFQFQQYVKLQNGDITGMHKETNVNQGIDYQLFYTIINNNQYLLDWMNLPKNILKI